MCMSILTLSVVDCDMQKVDALVFLAVGRYMDKIIEYVQVILENKFAYVANGSVYFDTKAFKYVFLFHPNFVGPKYCDGYLAYVE